MEENKINQAFINVKLLEAMDDWVRVIDKLGNIIFVNKVMKDKCKIKALVHRVSFDQDLVMADAVIPKSVSLMTILTKKSFVKEITFMGKDFSVSTSPILDDEGEIIYVVEVFRDISTENHIKRELFNTNRRMTDDLKMARQIQSKLLPDQGKIVGGVKVDYFYEPSEHLSGDIFDVINIDRDRVGIYMCDVVGHGVGASLLTMFVKQSMMSIIQEFESTSPSRILYELRNRFTDMNLSDNIYLTIFVGIYSKSASKFVFANAGHNCSPILKTKDSVKLLESTGAPICEILKEMTYTEKSVDIEKGDKLIFYTDGFVEITNYEKEEFGLERFLKSIKMDGDIIKNTVGKVIEFNWGEAEDDMALMVATIL